MKYIDIYLMLCIAVLRLWLRLNSKALSCVKLDHDEEILIICLKQFYVKTQVRKSDQIRVIFNNL